jgi:late competence protein required for DNA uptake (superfamily II DNA/RNA helicase)
MKFDQVRREFKRTLWGEELDNERYSNHVASSVELDFLHQYEGKKYSCKNCSLEYEENNIRSTTEGNYCSKCFQILFNNL